MAGSFLLLAGWVIDGTGGPAKKGTSVRVKNGLIVSVCGTRDGDLNRPDMIDLSQCTLLPGIVDCHTHLSMSGTNSPEVRRWQLKAPFEDIRKAISTHTYQHLSHGVVAVRDGGDYAGHTLRYKRECLYLDGVPICVKSAGKAWRASGRYGKLIGRPPLAGNTLAQAIASRKEDIDHVKIVNSGLNSLTQFRKETPPQFTQAQLRRAVKTAGDLGLRTMVHANGRLPVEMAIEARCHSIEHGFFMGKDNLKKMAERQITWVPTAYTMKACEEAIPYGRMEREVSRKNLDHQLGQIFLAGEYGVPIAIGTDCGALGVHHGSAVVEEIRLLIHAGFSPEKAIQCATSNGAALLGLKDEFGRLSPGMPATFVATRGDPGCLPEALNTPKCVFIRGGIWNSGNREPKDVRWQL
ncbi:MAG: amidohydrolase family protein [Thermodesulfobacteriota bacterium]|nr:amidohydrolase family protein [Thermodesulfobacteriota bacterium]